MTSPETFVIVWFDGEDVYTLKDTAGDVMARDTDGLQGEISGFLRTEDEIDNALPTKRYAVPVDLAREVFGWDLK